MGYFQKIPWIEWACYLVIIALIFSPFLLSIGMILLITMGLIDTNRIHEGVYLNQSGYSRLKNFNKYKVYWVLTLFFWIVVWRCWPIEDGEYLLERLRIKLPFLLLPLVFIALPEFAPGFLNRLFRFMLIVFVLTSFGVLVNYWQNYEVLTEMIRKGHHIPTPRNHIRFSMLLAWSIIGWVFLFQKSFRSKTNERFWIAGATLYLFVFIHVLSVKSGLLILYIGLFTFLARYVWVERKWLIGSTGILLMLVVPILAYQFIPSFKNKIDYTRYDLMMFWRGEGGVYSDSGRLASLDIGWQLAKENTWWGVGSGNLEKAVVEQYTQIYPDYVEPFMIQNQFLYVWAGTGFLGLMLFVFTFLYPFFYERNFGHPLILLFYAMAFGAWMIEHAIENAVGVGHFLFFLLVLLKTKVEQ